LKTYKHIFFDLDHTLWDYELNSREVLIDLYQLYELKDLGIGSSEEFYLNFTTVNEFLWSKYNRGEITSAELRENRFKMIFSNYCGEDHPSIPRLSQDYLAICPLKSAVVPYTFEVLDYLKIKYSLDIITNGFNEIQKAKLESSGLTSYFNHIFTSELAGFRKPHPKIFEFAVDKNNTDPSQCIMIGDNLETDIQGARNADIDHVFFNPKRSTHQESPTYEVNCLSHLKQIL